MSRTLISIDLKTDQASETEYLYFNQKPTKLKLGMIPTVQLEHLNVNQKH